MDTGFLQEAAPELSLWGVSQAGGAEGSRARGPVGVPEQRVAVSKGPLGHCQWEDSTRESQPAVGFSAQNPTARRERRAVVGPPPLVLLHGRPR